MKTFCAIKSSAPYTSYVMDLNNLNILFNATILDIPNPSINVYNNGITSEIVLDDKQLKKTLISPHLKQVTSFSNFIKKHFPKLEIGSTFFEIKKNFLIIKIGREIQVYDI